MGDDAAEKVSLGDVSETPPEGGGKRCRNCGLGCLGFVILLAILFGALSASAGASLDARRESIQGEIAAVREELAKPRQTLLQSASGEGNAVVYYRGLEWVFLGGKVPEHRAASRAKRPILPADVDEVLAKCSPDGAEIDAIAPGYLVSAYAPALRWRHKGQVSGEHVNGVSLANLRKALAVYRRYRPALRYVHAALKEGRCDWETDFQRGARADTPSLFHYRTAANLLVFEAMRQPPKEALATGLEIVGMGEDLSRQGTLIGDMVGVAIVSIGLGSLMQTLGRPGLEGSDYRRVIDALGRYRIPVAHESFERERILMVATALEVSGRSLAPDDPEKYSDMTEVGVITKFDVFNAREIEGYEHFARQNMEVAKLPIDQQEAAARALEEEVQSSSYVFARIAIPNLVGASRHLRSTLGLVRATRVVAAAHLRRLESGSFPDQLDALSALVGPEGLEDPTANPPAPLRYRVQEGVVTCWIVDENAVDDGGPTVEGDDAGISSHVPRELKLELPPEDE